MGLSFGDYGGDFNQRPLVNYHEIGASALLISTFLEANIKYWDAVDSKT